MMASARFRGLFALVIAMVWISAAAADEPAELILGTDRPVLDVVAELPWELGIVAATPADKASLALVPECRESRVVILRSEQPLRDTAAGPVYLELSVTSLRFDDADKARQAFASVMYGADPDTGLSYAWDLLVATDANLHLLHAPCILAARWWDGLTTTFVEAVSRGDGHPIVARCSCGAGCRATP